MNQGHLVCGQVHALSLHPQLAITKKTLRSHNTFYTLQEQEFCCAEWKHVSISPYDVGTSYSTLLTPQNSEAKRRCSIISVC